ncbi:NADH-dependent fumarate reductase, putative [Trypanosoma cruzi]|uniref:NADH-dependent fumarate reductase, putative n=1 Tax=Trypanosoma cruzi (strain CL Brener) TaxID=353153 RepID=Q4D079_TRYCC|nr:NADH-dependent fumarate reductase, putative [Trypanosoma cruzi]EAN85938.1 NADH-dependent fumarate reductase, putative [Trypanosoma cruzi]|eukprot:XP_807789.1 NADH-dependent fumarate reductase [Trypanosoma cruzi strain CL Brener]
MFSTMRILLRTATIGVATGTMAMTTTLVSGAHLAAVRWSSSSTSDNSPALLSQRSFFSGGADGRSSASIVVVDAELAAKERDRIAREMLSQNMPSPHAEERLVVTMRGLEHTVPYTLRIVLNGPNEAKNGEVIAGKVLKEAFEVVDQHLNHYNPESEVSAIPPPPPPPSTTKPPDRRYTRLQSSHRFYSRNIFILFIYLLFFFFFNSPQNNNNNNNKRWW